MSLKPGEDIGMEAHNNLRQRRKLSDHEAKAVIESNEYQLKDGDVVIVPAGAKHNIINTSSDKDLKLYTLYSPPNHPEGTIHKTRQEAIDAEEHDH